MKKQIKKKNAAQVLLEVRKIIDRHGMTCVISLGDGIGDSTYLGGSMSQIFGHIELLRISANNELEAQRDPTTL